MSVSLNGSRGSWSGFLMLAFWLSASSRFLRKPANEKADTFTSPSLSSARTNAGLTTSGSVTSSSSVGRGVNSGAFSSSITIAGSEADAVFKGVSVMGFGKAVALSLK
jgi:BRCT domain type II-containing protein